jgi:ubiquinone/menaquinone biosynthesis C-methylase UbiE
MMSLSYRDHDKRIWESIFREVPEDWFEAGPSDAMRRCLEFFQGKDVNRLLDVGCGVGRWSLFLGSMDNLPIVGIDYSPNGVRVAASWAQRCEKRLSFVAGDAVSLPFLEESFDGVVVALLLDNLSHEDSRGALREIDAAVSPGAYGFFVFNPWLTQSQREAISESGNPTKDCMQVVYTDEEIRALFETWSVLNQTVSAEGFRIVEAKKDL